MYLILFQQLVSNQNAKKKNLEQKRKNGPAKILHKKDTFTLIATNLLITLNLGIKTALCGRQIVGYRKIKGAANTRSSKLWVKTGKNCTVSLLTSYFVSERILVIQWHGYTVETFISKWPVVCSSHMRQ